MAREKYFIALRVTQNYIIAVPKGHPTSFNGHHAMKRDG